jgi:hypothetical protein
VADLFYSRFFELAPDARALFPQDIARQQLKLMDMIASNSVFAASSVLALISCTWRSPHIPTAPRERFADCSRSSRS